jgi:hypothetical protein
MHSEQSREDIAFREEVRAFLDDKLTADLRRAGRHATPSRAAKTSRFAKRCARFSTTS